MVNGADLSSYDTSGPDGAVVGGIAVTVGTGVAVFGATVAVGRGTIGVGVSGAHAERTIAPNAMKNILK